MRARGLAADLCTDTLFGVTCVCTKKLEIQSTPYTRRALAEENSCDAASLAADAPRPSWFAGCSDGAGTCSPSCHPLHALHSVSQCGAPCMQQHHEPVCVPPVVLGEPPLHKLLQKPHHCCRIMQRVARHRRLDLCGVNGC